MGKMKDLILVSFLLLLGCNKQPESERPGFQWPVSTPAAQGLNQGMIDKAYLEADQTGFVDALLIIKNGYLVAERYYNGYNRNTAHQIWSDTKSFMSALVGIALHQGLIESTDKKVMDYFPEYVYDGMEPRFFDVTVRHLLTMRMGIDNEQNTLIPVVSSGDWLEGTFNLPLLYDPGQKFAYNSLQTHLLSAIITKTSGMSTLEFAVQNLTGPMGIEIILWNHDPQGYNVGGYDIYMKPYDMAVLGYMYLNDGMIDNRQIVPAGWVDVSLQKTAAKDGTWGVLTDYNYGYLWWLGKMNGYSLFMAWGMGGQYIMNFPELNLIVVTTANPDISWDNEQEYPILEIVSKYILTAL